MQERSESILKTVKLTEIVVFMPPANEITGDLKNNIEIADRGQQVVLLEKIQGAAYVMYKNLTKWIPDTWIS